MATKLLKIMHAQMLWDIDRSLKGDVNSFRYALVNIFVDWTTGKWMTDHWYDQHAM